MSRTFVGLYSPGEDEWGFERETLLFGDAYFRKRDDGTWAVVKSEVTPEAQS